MKTSPGDCALIEGREGVVLSAYKDSAGILTIGVGHTSAAGVPKVVDGMKNSAKQASEIITRDLACLRKRYCRVGAILLLLGAYINWANTKNTRSTRLLRHRSAVLWRQGIGPAHLCYLKAIHFPYPPDDGTNVMMHAGAFLVGTCSMWVIDAVFSFTAGE